MSGRRTLRISLQPSWPSKSSRLGSAAWSMVPMAPSATTTRSASAASKPSEVPGIPPSVRTGGKILFWISCAAMGSYQTVIVGTDGSESSYRAVDKAAAVAKDAGATLVIACAYAPQRGAAEQSGTMRGAWKGAKPNPGGRDRDALGDEAYKVTGSSPAES